MTGTIARAGITALAVAAFGGCGVAQAFAGQHGPAPGTGVAYAAQHGSAPVRPHDPLDGFTVDALPCGLGANLTGFAYEWEDVRFRTRVWETGPDADGAYRTDLNILVLRGDKLRDITALRDFLAYYEEKDGHWRLDRFSQDGAPGYRGDDQAFFSPEPGVGVLVKIYDHRFDVADMMRVIGGMHRVPAGR